MSRTDGRTDRWPLAKNWLFSEPLTYCSPAQTQFTAAVTRTHIGLHAIRIGTCALAAVSAERLLVLPIIKHPSPQLTLTVGASSIVSGGQAVDWRAEKAYWDASCRCDCRSFAGHDSMLPLPRHWRVPALGPIKEQMKQWFRTHVHVGSSMQFDLQLQGSCNRWNTKRFNSLI